MKAWISLLCVAFLGGCAGANIATGVRQASSDNDMQTRCEPLDMRDKIAISSILAKYDGWRVFYISEYTTQNKVGTSGVVCFEKKK